MAAVFRVNKAKKHDGYFYHPIEGSLVSDREDIKELFCLDAVHNETSELMVSFTLDRPCLEQIGSNIELALHNDPLEIRKK